MVETGLLINVYSLRFSRLSRGSLVVARTGLRAGAALQIPPPYHSNTIACANPHWQCLRENTVRRLLSCAWYVVLRPNRDISMRG